MPHYKARAKEKTDILVSVYETIKRWSHQYTREGVSPRFAMLFIINRDLSV
jgi:hypothetical protein